MYDSESYWLNILITMVTIGRLGVVMTITYLTIEIVKTIPLMFTENHFETNGIKVFLRDP